MPIKRKKITIETREVWIVHRPKTAAHRSSEWCVVCAAEVELVTAEAASRLTGQSVREIFRRIELAQLHFLESPTGGVLLCLPSLLADHFGGKLEPVEIAKSVLPPISN